MRVIVMAALAAGSWGQIAVDAQVKETVNLKAYGDRLGSPLAIRTMCRADLKPAYAAAFGTDAPAYHDIERAESADEAQTMADIRRDYRESFLKLCLSRAKRDLIP